jgi:Rrf2 family protein
MERQAPESHRGRPVGSGVIWPSAKTVYALRACAALASAYPQRRLLKTAEIARVSGAPIRFLSKILAELRVAGLVSGKRGYYGGYILARDPNEIRVTELMVAVGSHDLLVPLPPQLEQPRSAFVDDLRSKLSQVALEAFGAATVAELADGNQLVEL